MATLILINAVRVTPAGLVWPGSLFDTVQDAAQYNLILSAGGIFWPQSDVIVAAQQVIVQSRRLNGGIDLETAQGLMFAAVSSSLSSTGTTFAADLLATTLGKGTALIGDNQSGGTLAAKLNEIGATALPTADTQADATHYGVVKLSSAPAVANTPIAIGPNSIQLSQNNPLVAGTVTIATLTFTALTTIIPIRNNPDPLAANWGALSISASTPGAPGSITVVSSDAGDTSSVDLLLIG